MHASFSAERFLSLLENDNLQQVVVQGMVKRSEGSSSQLLFCSDNQCERWIPVPMEIVEQVEYLATLKCKDHEHPLVRLRLQLPPKEDIMARFFAEVALRPELMPQLKTLDPPARCQYYYGKCLRQGVLSNTAFVQTNNLVADSPSLRALPQRSPWPGERTWTFS